MKPGFSLKTKIFLSKGKDFAQKKSLTKKK
jgi:hypothetical protein